MKGLFGVPLEGVAVVCQCHLGENATAQNDLQHVDVSQREAATAIGPLLDTPEGRIPASLLRHSDTYHFETSSAFSSIFEVIFLSLLCIRRWLSHYIPYSTLYTLTPSQM